MFYDTCCSFASSNTEIIACQSETPPLYSDLSCRESIRGEVRHSIEHTIDTLDSSLRALSLDIHGKF